MSTYRFRHLWLAVAALVAAGFLSLIFASSAKADPTPWRDLSPSLVRSLAIDHGIVAQRGIITMYDRNKEMPRALFDNLGDALEGYTIRGGNWKDGISLLGTSVKGVTFQEVNFTPPAGQAHYTVLGSLTGATFVDCKTIGQSFAELVRAGARDFPGLKVNSGSADFTKAGKNVPAIAEPLNLSGSTFTDVNVRGLHATGGIDLTEATVKGGNWQDVTMTGETKIDRGRIEFGQHSSKITIDTTANKPVKDPVTNETRPVGLTDANLSGSKVRELVLRGSSHNLQLDNAEIVNANLSGLNATSSAGRAPVSLANAQASGTQLPKNVRGWNFAGSVLHGAQAPEKLLAQGSNWDGAQIGQGQHAHEPPMTIGAGANFSDASWNNLKAHNVEFDAVKLEGVTANDANLSGTTFKGNSSLRGIQAANLNLTDSAVERKAEVSFFRSVINTIKGWFGFGNQRVTLEEAKLSGLLDWTGNNTNISEMNFKGVTFAENTKILVSSETEALAQLSRMVEGKAQGLHTLSITVREPITNPDGQPATREFELMKNGTVQEVATYTPKDSAAALKALPNAIAQRHELMADRAAATHEELAATRARLENELKQIEANLDATYQQRVDALQKQQSQEQNQNDQLRKQETELRRQLEEVMKREFESKDRQDFEALQLRMKISTTQEQIQQSRERLGAIKVSIARQAADRVTQRETALREQQQRIQEINRRINEVQRQQQEAQRRAQAAGRR